MLNRCQSSSNSAVHALGAPRSQPCPRSGALREWLRRSRRSSMVPSSKPTDTSSTRRSLVSMPVIIRRRLVARGFGSAPERRRSGGRDEGFAVEVQVAGDQQRTQGGQALV